MSEQPPPSQTTSPYADLTGNAAERVRESLTGLARLFPQSASSPAFVEEAQKIEVFKGAIFGSLVANPGANIPPALVEGTMAYMSAVRLQFQLLAQASTQVKPAKSVSTAAHMQKRA